MNPFFTIFKKTFLGAALPKSSLTDMEYGIDIKTTARNVKTNMNIFLLDKNIEQNWKKRNEKGIIRSVSKTALIL